MARATQLIVREEMNTKTPIVSFFAKNLPEFIFDGASRPNLLFRRLLQDGLFECTAVQPDSKSHAFAPVRGHL